MHTIVFFKNSPVQLVPPNSTSDTSDVIQINLSHPILGPASTNCSTTSTVLVVICTVNGLKPEREREMDVKIKALCRSE